MLLFLERDKFIKLFKFGELTLPISRFLDSKYIAGEISISFEALDAKVPSFEQDHEILILEVSKESLQIGPEIRLKISFVKRVFPLTADAESYLFGRLNQNIKLQKPVFESDILDLKVKRDMQLRYKAKDAMYKLFSIERKLALPYEKEIEDGITSRLGNVKLQSNDSYLTNLVTFNRNPVYPSGPVEYLFKAASVFVQMKGATEHDFENGPLFNYLMANAKTFNTLNHLELIKQFQIKSEANVILKELSKKYSNINALFIGFYFLYLKDQLNKHDNDLAFIQADIKAINVEYPVETAVITLMLGMLFSFDNLYESIYKLSGLQIFKSEIEPNSAEQLQRLKADLSKLSAAKEDLSIEKEKLIAKIADLMAENKSLKQSISKPPNDLDKGSDNPNTNEDQLKQVSNKKHEYIESTLDEPSPGLANQHSASQPQPKNTESPPIAQDKSSVPLLHEGNNTEKNVKDDAQHMTLNETEGKYIKKNNVTKPSKSASSKPKRNKKSTNAPILFPESNNLNINEDLDDFQFDMHAINSIINSVEQEELNWDKKAFEEFKTAFLNYDPKGARLYNLLNEIEELQKDHELSDEIALKIRELIIAKMKKK